MNSVEPAAIRCESLSRRYGEVQALQPLDLEVPAGSIFGFLGRNGAGKTTTIRLLTGLAKPSSGRAWVHGVETTRADSAARRVFGYLPQDPTFYNWMTPREYLAYVGHLSAMDGAILQGRVEEMLELVDLQDAGNRRIGGFSGGMIQRLGIAQALVHNPPVLFLDEPTSALDPAGRYAVLELIDRLRGTVTVFLSSHILGDVERLCDTVGIIRQGALILVSERDELLNRYASNVIVLELDPESLERLPDFVRALQEKAWVTAISVESAQLRIVVGDVVAARQLLLPFVVSAGMHLARYEWVKPSLEEIFLGISA